jgi:hypothetical protein
LRCWYLERRAELEEEEEAKGAATVNMQEAAIAAWPLGEAETSVFCLVLEWSASAFGSSVKSDAVLQYVCTD